MSSSSSELDFQSVPVLEELKSFDPGSHVQCERSVPTLSEGENYRFHFDMTRCIGCRCCEVACNEQNNNPSEVTWRRVGEIEGGSYPHVARLHLSMSCNHCLEPSCLEGCPVDAYTKLANGVVDHDAETCIGCQYCTWNCPYGVPQFNPERRVVTKCNLCVDRLEEGQLPACVNACPTEAIQVESFKVEEWRKKIDQADAPGVPPADLTGSTTRITLPKELPETFGAEAVEQLQPEAAHWSLVIFLVLSQWSVGLFMAVPAFFDAQDSVLSFWILGAWFLGGVSLQAALFHLGRPIHAIRAIKAWRHSWLSREVIAFSLFGGMGFLQLAYSLLSTPSGWLFQSLSGLTVLFGLAGILSSVGIYRIPARPAWDSSRTLIQFLLVPLNLASFTAALLGTYLQLPATTITLLVIIGISACVIQAFSLLPLVIEGLRDRESLLYGTACLLMGKFKRLFWLRMALFLIAMSLAALTWVVASSTLKVSFMGGALLLSLSAEILSRYLFFVTVVPRNMPGNFFTTSRVH